MEPQVKKRRDLLLPNARRKNSSSSAVDKLEDISTIRKCAFLGSLALKPMAHLFKVADMSVQLNTTIDGLARAPEEPRTPEETPIYLESSEEEHDAEYPAYAKRRLLKTRCRDLKPKRYHLQCDVESSDTTSVISANQVNGTEENVVNIEPEQDNTQLQIKPTDSDINMIEGNNIELGRTSPQITQNLPQQQDHIIDVEKDHEISTTSQETDCLDTSLEVIEMTVEAVPEESKENIPQEDEPDISEPIKDSETVPEPSPPPPPPTIHGEEEPSDPSLDIQRTKRLRNSVETRKLIGSQEESQKSKTPSKNALLSETLEAIAQEVKLEEKTPNKTKAKKKRPSKKRNSTEKNTKDKVSKSDPIEDLLAVLTGSVAPNSETGEEVTLSTLENVRPEALEPEKPKSDRPKKAMSPELLLSDSDDDAIDQLMYNIMDIKIKHNLYDKDFFDMPPSDVEDEDVYQSYSSTFNGVIPALQTSPNKDNNAAEEHDVNEGKTETEGKEKKLFAEPKRAPQCKICSQVFTSYIQLKKHRLIHNGDTPYQCLKCDENHETLDQLIAHLRKHEGKRPYVCRKCNEGFKTMEALEKHRPLHILRKPEAPKKSFCCEVCKKEFRKLCDLERHTRVHTGEKPSVCNICNRRFQQAHNLNKHLLIHTQEKPFQCEICSKRFGRNDVLNRHLLTHSVKKPNTCDVCLKSFIRVSQLNAHKDKYHSSKTDDKHAS